MDAKRLVEAMASGMCSAERSGSTEDYLFLAEAAYSSMLEEGFTVSEVVDDAMLERALDAWSPETDWRMFPSNGPDELRKDMRKALIAALERPAPSPEGADE